MKIVTLLRTGNGKAPKSKNSEHKFPRVRFISGHLGKSRNHFNRLRAVRKLGQTEKLQSLRNGAIDEISIIV